MRTPYVIIVVLLAVLVPLGFAADRGGSSAESGGERTSLAALAERVEALRDLTFTKLPDPQTVSPAQVRREGLADLDRSYPPAARDADETMYELLGLLPEGTDLRETFGSVFGEEVAGYYDPRTRRLRIVGGAAGENRVLDEMVLAHELTHALEDQRIGFDLDVLEKPDDPGYAYNALIEGTATELMTVYLGRFFDSEAALGGLLAGSFAASGTADLPPFIVAGLLFPYQEGQRFVAELYRLGGRSWTLVDLALRKRRPVSTEHILHPTKYLKLEMPIPVELPAPGAGWRKLTGGTFGEWQTGQLLALSGRPMPDVSSGWRGDSYALYRRGEQNRLVMRWRWDSIRDAAEFGPALRAALAERPPLGKATVTEDDGVHTLVITQ